MIAQENENVTRPATQVYQVPPATGPGAAHEAGLHNQDLRDRGIGVVLYVHDEGSLPQVIEVMAQLGLSAADSYETAQHFGTKHPDGGWCGPWTVCTWQGMVYRSGDGGQGVAVLSRSVAFVS